MRRLAIAVGLCALLLAPTAAADEVDDAAARNGLSGEQERIQRCIRHYESTDGKGSSNEYQYQKPPGGNQHDNAAGHIKDGSYTWRWRAQAGRCWGGGGSSGGGARRPARLPRNRLSHCEATTTDTAEILRSANAGESGSWACTYTSDQNFPRYDSVHYHEWHPLPGVYYEAIDATPTAPVRGCGWVRDDSWYLCEYVDGRPVNAPPK